jgi:hypothetical protein
MCLLATEYKGRPQQVSSDPALSTNLKDIFHNRSIEKTFWLYTVALEPAKKNIWSGKIEKAGVESR